MATTRWTFLDVGGLAALALAAGYRYAHPAAAPARCVLGGEARAGRAQHARRAGPDPAGPHGGWLGRDQRDLERTDAGRHPRRLATALRPEGLRRAAR